MIEAVVVLLLLHAPDGREVRINPDQITSMRASTAGHNQLTHENVECVVFLTDGKIVAVIEPCATIEKMLEKAK